MKTLLRDAVALAGLGCLATGLHLQFGPGVALIVVGVLLLAPVIFAVGRR